MPNLLTHLRVVLMALLALATLVCPAELPKPFGNGLDPIRKRDFLQVATRTGPITFYEGAHGPTGFEYELMRRFAHSLGVSLAVKNETRIDDVFDDVRRGDADMGAAALAMDLERPGIRYSRPILELQPLVVYRRGLPPVRTLDDLVGLRIGVIQGSGNADALRVQQQSVPGLGWREAGGLTIADLLEMVERDDLDAAVVYTHQFKLNRLFFPNVERGFALGQPFSLSWAFAANTPTDLLSAANAFIDDQRASGELDTLVGRYFGHDDYLEYVGARLFIHHVGTRLPRFVPYFKTAARDTGFDWRLLAALGYQESHWEADATSPTGVRGLMMLTRPTANEIGIDNRLDPRQSVEGGARYLQHVKQRLDNAIPEPDRTWMALAAYNVGLGHLYDAQEIAKLRGKNPDRWADVREALPLLQQKAWYSQVRHGYARGGEPVIYVRNIRRYYEILKYVNRSQQQFDQLGERALDDEDVSPLEIVAPLL
ncbi:membrane-bound lytic murein transglycosylase MltF [Salinicola rhizosphaerae]|uniref:Membrane-bound lytic murein transglycosylase F n=1 Tax=Salinicola rhizosphaerae TaxID=1443141 RepID=A0ABQ3DZ46_9GAMM|nr:membrane-bound lytic murein transglycosylase MltF [Salinicola rhizosphaerae]GHB18076.1 membrane-bound lytic murein transglycosylase F [Salinicola rhizosphaerae]